MMSISNAIQGLKEHSTTRVVLDDVLGLELSIFARLLKMRPGVDDNHVLVQQVANDLWCRQMHYVGCTRKDGQKEFDIIRRGSHGTGPEDKAAH